MPASDKKSHVTSATLVKPDPDGEKPEATIKRSDRRKTNLAASDKFWRWYLRREYPNEKNAKNILTRTHAAKACFANVVESHSNYIRHCIRQYSKMSKDSPNTLTFLRNALRYDAKLRGDNEAVAAVDKAWDITMEWPGKIYKARKESETNRRNHVKKSRRVKKPKNEDADEQPKGSKKSLKKHRDEAAAEEASKPQEVSDEPVKHRRRKHREEEQE